MATVVAPLVFQATPTGLRRHAGGGGSGPLPTLKAGLRGLVCRDLNALQNVPYAECATINTFWENVEPTQGNYNWAPIDNAMNGHPGKRWRIKMFAGTDAPDYLMTNALWVEPDCQSAGCVPGWVPRWWTAPFRDAYHALHAALAARYDTDERVCDITFSRSTGLFAEPFILNTDEPAGLYAAGLTRTTAEAAMDESLAYMMSVWRHTTVSVAGHFSWQYIDDVTGQKRYDFDDYNGGTTGLRAKYEEWRALYGHHLVIKDHGLRPSRPIPDAVFPPSAADDWYEYMHSVIAVDPDQPVGWQLALQGEDMTTAVQMAVNAGAHWVETSGFGQIPEPTRHNLHDALVANAGG